MTLFLSFGSYFCTTSKTDWLKKINLAILVAYCSIVLPVDIEVSSNKYIVCLIRNMVFLFKKNIII
jgi:hypothetical protein